MDDRRGVSSISTVCFLIVEYFSHVFVVVVVFVCFRQLDTVWEEEPQ